MRYLFTIVVALMIVFSSQGQVTVGTGIYGKFQDFDKGEYDVIKSKTTVFVVDDLEVSEFEDMIKEVWTYNNYLVVDRENYDEKKYKTEKYAPFIIEGMQRTFTSSSGMVSEFVYIYYHYYYYTFKKKRKKTKVEKRTISSVFFSGSPSTVLATLRSQTFGDLESGYTNYSLGHLKNYLQFINNEFENEGYAFAFAESLDKKKIKSLKTNTLYVPDFIKNEYNAWLQTPTGGTEKEREDKDDLFKNYNHPYEWITKDDLNNKILTATEDFYYLMYNRINSEKIIVVMNGFTGEVIYQDYQAMSYNIKKKDISRISKKIK